MTATALAGCVLWFMFFLPYGFAEPGSPDGDGFFAVMWILVELPWTWWAFVRRTYDQEITLTRRAVALAIATVSVVAAFVLREHYCRPARVGHCCLGERARRHRRPAWRPLRPDPAGAVRAREVLSARVSSSRHRAGRPAPPRRRTSSRKRFSVEPFSRISHRVRAVCPKTTCVMPSRLANAISPSPGRSAFTRTTVAPSSSASAMLRCSASRSGGVDPAGRLARRLDVDGVPARAQASGNPRAGADHARRVGARAHAHHHPLGNERRLQPSRCRRDAALSPISSATARSASSRSVEMFVSRKKLRERLLDLLRLVDLALPQPAVQLLDGHVDVDDFVGAVEEACRARSRARARR